ncbi:histidine kinase [Chitinibacter fontanus]|uniref:Histidine kinase n=1 Tax=Chitinibacter fontanus TaxID=1737446 RepID=A0A7D5V8A0_9NEIS|nr:histidine kinase [Chitinibacter fontanus]QLI80538.1 histidine kinase [Chitinibacter fontanus]
MPLFTNRNTSANIHWSREVGLLLLINTLIAIFLTVVQGLDCWAQNLLISHCIGCSIGFINFLLCKGQTNLSWSWRTPVAVILGIFAGFKLSTLFGAPDVLAIMLTQPDTQWRWIVTAIMVSFAACAFFVVFYHSLAYKNELEIAKREHAEAKQAEITAQLAMLQAQIEPHFLFNTLANVHSLITRDAALAQNMLEHLNDYLRASLSRTRQAQTSLADEVELIRALLAISQIRLGERLSYQIQIPADLLTAQLPPLLLQPLVENALEHGIEPALAGGTIQISAHANTESPIPLLILQVTDSGQGLQANQQAGKGVGLANVRARLQSLYGELGTLSLSHHQPHGVLAELRLPLQRNNDNAAHNLLDREKP